jgi:endonuclease/exonuclease/phosphatase family metal-dependent hydrolase
VRVLTWNLYHGRALPPAGHALLGAFAAALAGWEWDVALLQEVPPWWPPALAAATRAQERHVLTSRNLGLPLRRAIAARDPDRLGANGGGANAILVRGAILEHRSALLRRWPERRRAHGVRLADGTWVVNLHAHDAPAERARADCERARAAALAWAGGAALVLGGDLNLRRPALAGLRHVAGHHVDHVLARGLGGTGGALERGRLSDHAPVLATLG